MANRLSRLLLGSLFWMASAAAGQQATAHTEVAWGLETTTFSTPEGRLHVRLPDDAAAGDTLSGTVYAEPEGSDSQSRQANRDVLNGYVLEVENHRVPTGQKSWTWVAPAALAGGTTALKLLNSKGRTLATAPVSIHEPPSGAPPGTAGAAAFRLPTLGQAGRPVQVAGAFDGNLAGSAVRVGGQPAELLAESPRKLIARTPADAVGATRIEVEEGGKTAAGPFRSVAVSLSAPKTNLRSGETTTLTVTVSGLAGLEEDVPMQVENQTTESTDLEGGNVRVFTISPQDVGPDGTYTWNASLTGKQPGGFQISAYIPSLAESGPPVLLDVDGGGKPRPAKPKPAQKCCCPGRLEIRRDPGPLVGPWRISEYWPTVFPVWGERIGDEPKDITNDDSLGSTNVPQVLRDQRKSSHSPQEVAAGLPKDPEDEVPLDARNIGLRYQMIVDYRWVDSDKELACTFHWKKQNDNTELQDDNHHYKRNKQGKYEVQRPGAFDEDDRSDAARKTMGGTADRPERELLVDTPQRVHTLIGGPRQPLYFRWWIASDKDCLCKRSFIGAEGTVEFVAGAGAYPTAQWKDFKEGIESEADFTPKTHH